MTQEEFIRMFSDNPGSDEVMTEINRLWDENTRLTSDFAQADAERYQLRKDLDDANRRYRERFMSGEKVIPDKDNPENTFDSLFKEV